MVDMVNGLNEVVLFCEVLLMVVWIGLISNVVCCSIGRLMFKFILKFGVNF